MLPRITLFLPVRKESSANVTRERFFTCMRSFMSIQILKRQKTSPACITTEGFFPGVRHHVTFPVLLRWKRSAANLTVKRPKTWNLLFCIKHNNIQYLFIPVWEFICLLKWLTFVKALSHKLHLKSLTPPWDFKWKFKEKKFLKVLSQRLQGNGFCEPSSCVSIWVTSCLVLFMSLQQIGHGTDRLVTLSSSWDFWCFLKRAFVLKPLLQKSHTNGLSPIKKIFSRKKISKTL